MLCNVYSRVDFVISGSFWLQTESWEWSIEMKRLFSEMSDAEFQVNSKS